MVSLKIKSLLISWLKTFEFVRRTPLYQFFSYIDLNVNNADFKKRVLLSYINHPFRSDKKILYHSNITQARIIAKVFDELGYVVDIYNYKYTGLINYHKYELIFGFGSPLENSFKGDLKIPRIYYATEPYSAVKNAAIKTRLENLRKRRGATLPQFRMNPWPDTMSLDGSDAIFCTGNSWSMGTYNTVFGGKIYRVPIGVHRFFSSESIKRDWSKSKKNYLWLGGHGFVMKGLDICIEAFHDLGDDYCLHICGYYEEDVLAIYRAELKDSGSIIYHGPVKVNSDVFKKLSETCSFVILPSSSEAGCGSVLTAMGTGLVSVTTVETSIDNEEIGFRLSSSGDVDNVKNVVKSASSISEYEYKKKSELSIDYVKKLHTFESYENAFRDSLLDFTSNHST